MKYANTGRDVYYKEIQVVHTNGENIARLVVCGCNNQCGSCSIYKPDVGDNAESITINTVYKICNTILANDCKKLYIANCDAFCNVNLDTLSSLISRVHKKLPNVDIYCSTKYDMPTLMYKSSTSEPVDLILTNVKVIKCVDGKWEKNKEYHWCLM